MHHIISLYTKTGAGRSYRELTIVVLPSSLTRIHPFTWGYSPRPPVLVFGTVAFNLALGNFLGSVLIEVVWRIKLLADLGFMRRGFACAASSTHQCKSNNTLQLQPCVLPLKIKSGDGILTVCPSESHLCLSLGPTNPWMINIAKETLGLRCAGLSPALWLLIPTFSLPNAPRNLTISLHSS